MLEVSKLTCPRRSTVRAVHNYQACREHELDEQTHSCNHTHEYVPFSPWLHSVKCVSIAPCTGSDMLSRAAGNRCIMLQYKQELYTPFVFSSQRLKLLQSRISKNTTMTLRASRKQWRRRYYLHKMCAKHARHLVENQAQQILCTTKIQTPNHASVAHELLAVLLINRSHSRGPNKTAKCPG